MKPMLTDKKISLLRVIQMVILLCLFLGCAGKIPHRTLDNTSVLSITVGISGRASLLNYEKINSERIFFIRIDNEYDSLQKQKVIISNYKIEPFMVGFQMDNIDSFCFDLEPGTYAAVAAEGIGANSNAQYYIYFSKEMIKKTIVTLKENSIIYIGEFDFEDVSYNNQMKGADEVQLYYFNSGLIDGISGSNKPKRITWTLSPQHHSPSLKKSTHGKDEEIKFLNSIKSSFKNTEWHDNIINRLKTLSK